METDIEIHRKIQEIYLERKRISKFMESFKKDLFGTETDIDDLTLKVAKASEAMSKVETSTYLKKS